MFTGSSDTWPIGNLCAGATSILAEMFGWSSHLAWWPRSERRIPQKCIQGFYFHNYDMLRNRLFSRITFLFYKATFCLESDICQTFLQTKLPTENIKRQQFEDCKSFFVVSYSMLMHNDSEHCKWCIYVVYAFHEILLFI